MAVDGKQTPEEIWDSLSYTQRLGACAYIFNKVANDIGTYRYMIYNKLGFNEDSYILLCSDGLTINNALSRQKREGEK
jgi:serine/threonine protein phosphatase PrpC